MPRTSLLALAALLAAPPAPAQPPPKAEEELVDKVRTAIDRGVKYFEKIQARNGSWEGIVLTYVADQEGGTTALVTLALLNCGVKPEDRSVRQALDYLRNLPPKKTYVVGLQTMCFAEARQPKDLPLIQRNADWLVGQAIGLKAGQLEGWSYPMNAVADNSNTQYALLGLYAAKQAGAKIDDNVWKAIQAFYTRTQIPETPTAGSWSYHSGAFNTGPSFTMTVAGVCGLVIAAMGLEQSEQKLNEATGVAEKCGLYAENDPVRKGLNWIAAHFALEQKKSVFYNIYGIERLGRLTGHRFVGRFDWYREGCEYLVRAQNADGSITKSSGLDSSPLISTAFSLLFLSKGRTPVLVSKFAWGDYQDRGNGTFVEVGAGGGAVNWNRKHNDTRNVVEHASRELFKGYPLAWQVYDARRRDLTRPDDLLNEVGVLLQSPVVYLNGHTSPAKFLKGQQKEILKRYVEEGGFIFAEACCGDPDFAKGFRELMKELFPENDLKPLPAEHAVWRSFADVSPADFPDLEGLERGCRTVVVFSPKPLAGYWEERRFMPEPKKPAKNAGERAFRLAGNVIAYATGMELPKPRLTTTKLVQADDATKAPPRSYFKAAQLKFNEAEPAPAAMRNLMAHLRDNARLDVRLEKETLRPGDADFFKFKFLYLHGRKPFALDDLAVEDVRSNLQTGGLLLADACCGRKEFDKSFREAMAKLFPDSKLEVIPANDPFYTSARASGIDLGSVRCRREKADGTAEAELRQYPAHLEGIKIDGRWAVIYSKYDLGCALEGHKSSDCLGHDKESALRIGSAVVLYALKR